MHILVLPNSLKCTFALPNSYNSSLAIQAQAYSDADNLKNLCTFASEY